ncbi:MAG TPA: alanine racemase [Candidatus Dormibacteraeota bacterium]|nr:alanine racemase [Candidatus Dormibacteraeota bacterium]
MTEALLRWAEVDLQALAHNVGLLRARLRPGTRLLAVVKANAYGHGAVPVARAAVRAGADWLSVATLAEAAELRQAGVEAPILLMGPVPAGAEAEALALDLRLCVYEPAGLARLIGVAAGSGLHARLHLKVDTGMARLGCSPGEAMILARRIQEAPGLELEGLWTHFAEADDPASTRTQEQLQAFLAVVSDLASAAISPPILHAANSPAALQFPGTHLVLVRCGLPVYGYSPTAVPTDNLPLRPVLSWKARVVAVHGLDAGDRVGYGGAYVAPRPVRTATVSTGYADGYPRALSGSGELLVNGRRVPVIGRVSMDFITVDASAIPDVAVGDEAVIIGEQGEQRITADDLAQSLDTISWEVLARIGPRVERVVRPMEVAVAGVATLSRGGERAG